MPNHEDWIRPVDAVILDHLAEQRFDYVALIARETQLTPSYAERRVEALADHDLVEAVSHEVVYRITERGEQRLEAYLETAEEESALEIGAD